MRTDYCCHCGYRGRRLAYQEHRQACDAGIHLVLTREIKPFTVIQGGLDEEVA